MSRSKSWSLFVVRAVLVLLLALPAWSSAQSADPTAPFFDDSVVHDIYFTINSKDWETLKTNFLDNTYYPVDFRWNGQTVRNAGIRSRGTGSRSGVKPGLRLDFDRYTASQKFLGLKSLVLRNSTQDPTNMHERLAMLFFKRLGLKAPREVHARLFINNSYAGLYALVESIDKNFLAANFGDDAGYLYKYDYNVNDPPYYFTYRSAAASDYVPSPFKPETNENNPDAHVLERFAWTVNNSSDSAFPTAIAEFIDLPELIRHVASEAYIADNDGFIGNWGMNNFYLYRRADDHRFRFISWDKSEAFKDAADYSIWHNHLDTSEPMRNRLWTRVMAIAEYRNYYLDVLLECANVAGEIPADAQPGDTRGWLVREIDRQTQQITPAVLSDPAKPYSNDQFMAAVAYLRQFAIDRQGFVIGQVAASR